ncbi:type VI secretion system lipoprotein TssJ [Vibrio sp. JC009]|uniref:type VI secretion system lipoprotein TssJ n=1 Tax=Vibrio sp. JC009 TaxID=2912314 RepID=UPI0023B05106|nr:type VI secretion system lipoprotein TssJ [Vibrio sp. JC009]WED24552.1 type VI secretion system lipoprotein TssJ [Vibrio sp. JC009]
MVILPSRLSLLLVFISILAGCSIFEEDEPKDCPSKVTFSLVSDSNMNPDILGESAPVEIQVFELKDDSMFMSASYDQISQDYKKALRSNFVEIYDYVLMPDQFKFISEFEVSDDTSYIGVVAHFADPEISEWKKAVKVVNKGRVYHLLMLFKGNVVKLDRVE